jgi:CBS domain containing-hemolysin-like protein
MDDVIAEVMDDDAHSADSPAVVHEDGSLSLDGEVTLTELTDDHGITIATGGVTTVAGVVLAASRILPSVGTSVTVQDHELSVEEMVGRKITRVRVRAIATPAEVTADSDDPD